MADRLAFVAFYEANAADVQRLLAMMFRDADLAEEATQEAFARAYVAWGRVGVMERPAAWVRVVAVRVAYRRVRRTGGVMPSQTGVDVAELVATREMLRVAIDGLSERQRAAVALRYFADLPLVDVARAMGCAVGTVKSTLHAALTRLGVELEGSAEELRDACG